MKKTQVDDREFDAFMKKSTDTTVDIIVRFMVQLSIPNDKELIKSILEETRCSILYTSWSGKDVPRFETYLFVVVYERNVEDFITKYWTCQQVKVNDQLPSGLLKPLEIPKWKWECVAFDFVVGLPKSVKKNDSILWVVVNRQTKSAHFILSNLVKQPNI